jgi:hypothetical protein
MSPSGPIIAQSLEFFGQGIVLLIGILVFLLFAGIVALVACVAVRVWVFRLRQRQAREAYLKRTRRADGKIYPPRGGGMCEQCGGIRKVIYFVPTGEKLCHDCYEAWWPIAEGSKVGAGLPATEASEARCKQAGGGKSFPARGSGLRADRAAARPQNRPVRSGDRKSVLARFPYPS